MFLFGIIILNKVTTTNVSCLYSPFLPPVWQVVLLKMFVKTMIYFLEYNIERKLIERTSYQKDRLFTSFSPESCLLHHCLSLCEVERGFHAELETWEVWSSQLLHLLPSMSLRLLEKYLVAQAIKVLYHSEVTSSHSKALSDIWRRGQKGDPSMSAGAPWTLLPPCAPL